MSKELFTPNDIINEKKPGLNKRSMAKLLEESSLRSEKALQMIPLIEKRSMSEFKSSYSMDYFHKKQKPGMRSVSFDEKNIDNVNVGKSNLNSNSFNNCSKNIVSYNYNEK